MTPRQLRDALDGLFAYDMGSTDSGIHDEALRERVKTHLHTLDRPALTRLIRDMWMSEEAIEAGYGVEDAKSFIDWLSDRMEFDL